LWLYFFIFFVDKFTRPYMTNFAFKDSSAKNLIIEKKISKIYWQY
jgi:hypothetical protein